MAVKKAKPPNRRKPIAQLSLAPIIHQKLETLAAATGISRSDVAAQGITELFAKALRSGSVEAV